MGLTPDELEAKITMADLYEYQEFKVYKAELEKKAMEKAKNANKRR